MAVKPIPDGYHSVTPYLTVKDGHKAIDFYQRAFGARVRLMMPGPNNSVGHAELEIGDSVFMLADESPQAGKSPTTLGGTSSGVMLYVTDVDKTFKQAVDAGAKATSQPENMFWGDRFGRLTDPFGHDWSLATHVEDVSPEEMQKRMAAMQPA
jgi:PhnB protein